MGAKLARKPHQTKHQEEVGDGFSCLDALRDSVHQLCSIESAPFAQRREFKGQELLGSVCELRGHSLELNALFAKLGQRKPHGR